MEHCYHFRERIIVTGVRLPSLAQIIGWLMIITICAFGIGGSIDLIDGGKYRASQGTTVFPITIPSDNLTNAVVFLEMDTGSISIGAGTSGNLLNGTLTGPQLQQDPDLSFSFTGQTGSVILKQDSFSLPETFSREDIWNLTLDAPKPIALSVLCNTGNVSIRPGDVPLNGLTVEMGAGDLLIDLTEWNASHLPITITGGLGSINITLPANTSIASKVETGIGSRTISGLQGSGGSYYVTGKNHSPVISLSVTQGIGDLSIGVAS